MGRHKTPNVVLKSRGSNKTRQNEPDAATGKVLPTMPLGAEAERAFKRVCDQLDGIGVLSPTYAETITQAAHALGDIEIASRDLDKRGHISITERGEIKNPNWTIKTSAQATAHKYLMSLGLSPTALGKLTGTKSEEENPFAHLMP
jgi:P27 family predicted phage terminase small subunit